MIRLHRLLADIEEAADDFEAANSCILGIYVEIPEGEAGDCVFYEWDGESLERRDGVEVNIRPQPAGPC